MRSFMSNQYLLNTFCVALIICLVQCTSINTSKEVGKRSEVQVQKLYSLDPKSAVESLVRNISLHVLKMMEHTEMNPKAHVLTISEQKLLKKAFTMLPPLHMSVLKNHLRNISFLDNMPIAAVTSPVNEKDDFRLFDIIFNASILKQTASEWLTEKERKCFKKDSSGISVSIEAGSMNALVYVLLHEATHIVDGAKRILPQQWKDNNRNSIIPGIAATTWSNSLTLLPAFEHHILKTNRYRHGGKVFSWDQALSVYSALKRTPLVSIYSTSSWHEDLAEYLTVYHFTNKLGQPFKIILNENRKVIFSYEPMESELVGSRQVYMNMFYNH